MPLRTLIFFIASIFTIAFAFGQNIPRVGSPYVKQYNKSTYQAGNQNWGIAVSNEGFIYVANTEGLLSFDGQEWRLHKAKNQRSLRSVNIDKEGRILVGGSGEFGVWERGKFGKMEYRSLSPLVKDQTGLKNDEIWRINTVGNRIFFHSFSKCYIYENNEIKTLTADGEPFLFSHQVNNRMFFEQLPSGLFELVNNSLAQVKGAAVLRGMNILSMLPFDKDKILIATSNHGLFIMENDGSISPWQNQVQQQLIRYQVNNGVKLYGDQFAFGTIQNGVYILNSKGELVQQINKNNGLQNNTVLSMTVDKQANLWVGLDNGVDRIDINSPLYYYADLTGKIGTVYAALIFQNKVYLGTNQGLFVSDWNGVNDFQNLDFSIVPNSHGQVWQLVNMNGQLLCGHNNGTFLVEGNAMRKISSVTGAWSFTAISGSNRWLQGNYTGIGLMQGGPAPSFIKQFQQIKVPIRSILQRSDSEFWATNQQNVYSMKLNLSKDDAQSINAVKAGLPSNTQLHGVYNLANNIVFATDSGFYQYDNIVGSFKPYVELNEQLKSFHTANKIIPIKQNEYWFVKKSHIAKVELLPEGKVKIDSSSWNSLRGKMMNDYEQIFNLDDQTSIIGMDNGFAIYFNQLSAKVNLPKPYITQVWNTSNGTTPLYDDLSIAYGENNLRFAYASPWYSSSNLKYSYWLEGYTDNWSDWEDVAFKDFTNLPDGNYIFHVRSMAPNGTQSEITSLEITIRPPWYRHWLAIVIYLLILTALFIIGKRYYEQHLKKEQQKLKAKMLADQEARLAKEAELNERKLMALKNDQLEQELEIKNRELANAAMNIVYKNEMLNNLHHELTNLNDSNGNKLSSDQLRKVSKLIDEAHSDDRDWDLFEKSFNEAHENFFKKLKSDYPALVPNDLKLCAYLRLNMSSKEIASLLNISTRGVEIRRYRLRKKLNLPTEKNLTEFLLEL